MNRKHSFFFILIFGMFFGAIRAQAAEHTIWHLTDIHVMAPEVCQNQGSAWETYNLQAPQLDMFSRQIFQAVIDSALTYRPEILIISGDLARNGEKVSHELVAEMLRPLKHAGINVYVVPGNHDLHNPVSYLYDGNEVRPSPQLSEDEFREMYNEYGYGDAVSHDDSTLSYVAYPTDDLAFLCMDSNDWSTAVANESELFPDTTERVSTAGKYSEATLQWMESEAAKARNSGRRIFVVQHHTLFQHYDNESQLLFSDMLNYGDSVNGESVLIQRMADMGVSAVFSGHTHFHDINYMVSDQGRKVWEINTGSAAENKPLYRVCRLSDNSLDVNTVVIRNVDLDGKGTPTDEFAGQWYFSHRQEYLRALCFRFWPAMRGAAKDLPDFLFTFTDFPRTYEQFYGLMDRYIIDDLMTLYHIMAVGNEHLTDEEFMREFKPRLQDDLDATLLEICRNNTTLRYLMVELVNMVFPKLDLSTYALDYFASPLGNYLSANGGEIIDDDSCTIPLISDGPVHVDDNEIPYIQYGSDVYDIYGRKVSPSDKWPGLYISAGRKFIQR